MVCVCVWCFILCRAQVGLGWLGRGPLAHPFHNIVLSHALLRFMLASLERYSDSVFRTLCYNHGARDLAIHQLGRECSASLEYLPDAVQQNNAQEHRGYLNNNMTKLPLGVELWNQVRPGNIDEITRCEGYQMLRQALNIDA